MRVRTMALPVVLSRHTRGPVLTGGMIAHTPVQHYSKGNSAIRFISVQFSAILIKFNAILLNSDKKTFDVLLSSYEVQ
jgi:hypothetical protein